MRRAVPIASIATLVLLLALLLKFLWPLWTYDVPLGYDAGFYRYLFVRHGLALPPFWLPELDPWARGHPLGLFFFTSLLVKAGLPVDWLVGWIWNIFPVLLALVLARVTAKRAGTAAGLCTLLAALLSVAYFDGFAAMYWKTYASLLWVVLTFFAIERRSWWGAIFGILAVATHHQTGLLFGLTLFSWTILTMLRRKTEDTRYKSSRLCLTSYIFPLLLGLSILLLGLLWYLPVWKDAVLVHLPTLLHPGEAPSGNFPSALFYLRMSGVLLLLGAYGFFVDVRRERWTLWQFAVLWSLLLVAIRFLFFRRFFLQLDFFLLPFAGIGIADLWRRLPRIGWRMLLSFAVAVQLLAMQRAIIRHEPQVDAVTFRSITSLPKQLPADAFVLGLENQSATVLRGWLPLHHVGGPGLFEVFWDYAAWDRFLFGTHEERVVLFATLPTPVYVFASPLFRAYYGDYATAFLADPCFVPVGNEGLYRVICR